MDALAHVGFVDGSIVGRFHPFVGTNKEATQKLRVSGVNVLALKS